MTSPGTNAVPALPPPATPGRRDLLLRAVLAAVLLLLGAAGIAVLRLWPGSVSALLRAVAAAENRLGVAGLLFAVLVQTLVALCGVLPASFGALAAGAAYGVAGGFVSAALGTLLGAAGGFALARSLFRPLVLRLVGRRRGFSRLDEAVARDGWRLVCLLRISPVMPFAVTSYALGLSALRWRPYLLGTLASLPALLGYVLLGHLSRSGLSAFASGGAGPLHWALLALAIAATALLTLRLGRIARIALRLPDAPPRTP
ncbi:MAG: VTT domain-containing protein [Gluconacetobacter diazotrophicus]|nr:VTT domain-containing protein [Gluconacetobacter diazotrophicus]